MGKHRKPEENVTPDVALSDFEGIVAGVECPTRVECEACERREALFRAKPCGEDEYTLLCGLCWQAVSLDMMASVARALADDGLPICGPCARPIPALPFLTQHIEIEQLPPAIIA